MFSQLRNVVESLSSSLPEPPGHIPPRERSGSRNGQNEGRSRTPTPRRAATSSSRTTTPTHEARAKMTLDQRLKATFVLGESSELNTPSGSGRESPAKLTELTDVNPALYPLPLSPPPSPNQIPIELPPEDGDRSLVQDSSSDPPSLPDEAPSNDTETAVASNSTSEPDDVALLQTQLKLLEAKFSDVSSSLLRLQAEKEAANKILQSVIPGKGIQDLADLQQFTSATVSREKSHGEEVSRLVNLQSLHDSRLAELRDVHRLESASQREEIDSLKKQLREVETLFSATTAHSSTNDATIKSLRDELNVAQKQAKEEEEKRVKAVGLLKTIRQKLVKTEKERDDAVRASETAKQKETEALGRDQAQRVSLEADLQKLKEENERRLLDMKSQWQKDVQQTKSAAESEVLLLKESYEERLSSLKATHAAEFSVKHNHIKTLEQSVQSLSREKTELFEQLELRTAELESSQHLLEQVQVQSKELQFRLRDTMERLTALQEELSEVRENGFAQVGQAVPSDMAALLLETEGKYEARLGDARNRIRILEQERIQAEEEWSRGSAEHAKAVDRLRKLLEEREKDNLSNVERQKAVDEVVSRLTASLEQAEEANARDKARLSELDSRLAQSRESDISLRQDLHDAVERAEACVLQIEALRNQETQLKANNKNLRDELRKLQSSVALLEKQRNPGVGYWSSANQTPSGEPVKPTSRSSISSEESQGRATGDASRSEEEVSLEYLRNVILQFLEHKEMRANLVRVLSTILRFTPQETRRLMAKI